MSYPNTIKFKNLGKKALEFAETQPDDEGKSLFIESMREAWGGNIGSGMYTRLERAWNKAVALVEGSESEQESEDATT